MKTLKVDDFPLPNQFKTPNGWMEEDKTVAFWSMLSYPDIFVWCSISVNYNPGHNILDI